MLAEGPGESSKHRGKTCFGAPCQTPTKVSITKSAVQDIPKGHVYVLAFRYLLNSEKSENIRCVSFGVRPLYTYSFCTCIGVSIRGPCVRFLRKFCVSFA